MRQRSAVSTFLVLVPAGILAAVLSGCTTAAPDWTFPPSSASGVGPPATSPPATSPPATSLPATSPPATSTQAPAATAAPPADHGGMSPQPVPDSAGPILGTLVVRAFDIGYEPAALSVGGPGRYLVRFVNDGTVAHDITFADGTMIDAPAGATVEGEVLIPPDGLAFACSIPGHAQAGQEGMVEPMA